MPDGKLLQLPSTHMISQEFLRAFNVKFKDNTGKELTPYSTCYGPAISRIFGALVIVHGGDKGLRFPWSVSPVHVAFVPLSEKAEKKAQDLAKKIDARVEVDTRDMSPGEKFNYWELKGIPIRVDIGDKELKEKKVSVFRRDLNKKELILEKDFTSYVKKIMGEYDINLRKQADSLLEGRIKNVKTMKELKEAIESGAIVRAPFCSIEKEGSACADKITEATGGQVRGKKLDNEKASGNCIVCGKKAHEVVYIGRSY
jgi:prolyl-tRNA synthetase